MRISAKISIWLAAFFAVVCFSVAFNGFTSLGDIADPTQRADAKGFAWFWTVLGMVGVVFGGVGVWLVKTATDEEG